MANKFYAVKKGLVPGIYDNWESCKSNVIGFPGAVFKGFKTIEEAEAFLKGESTDTPKPHDYNYAYVDGSFNAKENVYGFGIVAVFDGQDYELNGVGNAADMVSMRNVSGEIMGAMTAISLAIEKGVKEFTIYYDYEGIEKWATGEWKRNLPGTIRYYDFVQKAKEKVNVRFSHVKGHSGVVENEEADKLAKQAVGL